MYDLQRCIANMQESQTDVDSPDLLETTSCQGRRLLNSLTKNINANNDNISKANSVKQSLALLL
jgi:hypothetical protein